MNMLSRRAPANLILALLLAGTAPGARAADDQQRIEELSAKMHSLYAEGKYAEALEPGLELIKLEPHNGEALYNVACLYALTGNKDRAIEHLEKSAAAGFRDLVQYENDKDLNSLRDDARFKKLIADLKGGVPIDGGAQPAPPGVHPPMSDRQREVQRLTERVVEESNRGNYEKALTFAEEALDLAPDLPLTNYNVACMHARLGNRQEALKYLEFAVDKGFNDTRQLETDPDLDGIRHEPRFRELLARVGGVERPVQPPPPPAPPPPPQQPIIVTPPAIAPAASGPWHVSLPDGYDREIRAPLLVVLHSANSNMRMATEEWEVAASDSGAILLTPQGNVPEGPDRYGWDRSIDRDAAEIMAAIDQVSRENRIDSREVVIAGDDQGATLACILAMRYPDRFAGVIAVAPRVERDSFDHRRVDLSGMRFYFMVEEDTPDAEATERFYKAVKKADAKAKFEEFDDIRDMSRKKRIKEQKDAIEWVLKEARDERKKERKREREEDD